MASWADEMSEQYLKQVKQSRESQRKLAEQFQKEKKQREEQALEQAVALKVRTLVDFVKACQVLRIPGDETTIYDYVVMKMQKGEL